MRSNRNSRTILHAALLSLMAASSTSSFAIGDQVRAQAAQKTAASNAACTALPNFYWEIGDRNGALASGSRGLSAPTATTQMAIYSAGKWLHAAYVFQMRNGQLKPDDIRALNMTSGYTASGQCTLNKTVLDCEKSISKFDASAVGKFSYGPGHFQKQAAIDLGLGKFDDTQLSKEFVTALGGGFTVTYNAPQIAGGARSSAADYAIFLRRILNGPLMVGALGANAVCTYTGKTDTSTGRTNCPNSLYSPASDSLAGSMESWHYSLGHWVEDDPVTGDGAFSSPGAAGFYPWIDANKMYYGILARLQITTTASAKSVQCGRLIRKAWLTAQAQ